MGETVSLSRELEGTRAKLIRGNFYSASRGSRQKRDGLVSPSNSVKRDESVRMRVLALHAFHRSSSVRTAINLSNSTYICLNKYTMFRSNVDKN